MSKNGNKFTNKPWISGLMAVMLGLSALFSGTGAATPRTVAAETAEATENTEAQQKEASLKGPVIDEVAQTVDYSYVYFGEYPQSEVTGEALTTEITGATYDVYGDAYVDGEKYRRMERMKDYYQYFAYEPICWRVITKKGHEAILQTDLILDCQVYSNETVNYWVDTSLRSWLNSYNVERRGFLAIAFTNKEIAAINGKLHVDSSLYGACARDKVYLLSGAQLYGMAELRYPYQMKKEASDYAIASGVRRETPENRYASWWVRNNQDVDYYLQSLAGYVDADGIRYQAGDMTYGDNSHLKAIPQDSTGIGVCPVIVLDLSQTELWNTRKEMLQGNVIDRGELTPYVETGMCGENLQYTIADGILTITGTGVMYDYKEQEPSPFQCRSDIKKLVIREGVESIGDWAFCRMTALEEVVLPQSMKTMGYASFYNCTALKNINFPSQMELISDYCFEMCMSLKELVLSDSIQQIGEGAFANCVQLTSVDLPEQLEKISKSMFYYCRLEEVHIPKSVITIGEMAFRNNYHLQKVVMEDGVVTIEDSAFENCTSLKEVRLSEKLVKMEREVFWQCTNLVNLNMPATLSEIGVYALYYTKWMANQRKVNPLVVINGILVDSEECSGEVIIPDTVKKIGSYQDMNAYQVEKVVIPATVKEIDSQAFVGITEERDAKIFYVAKGSAGEAFFKNKGWSGYYVIKANGEVEQVIESVSSETPLPSEEVRSSMTPQPSDSAIPSEEPIISKSPAPTESEPAPVTSDALLLGDVDGDGKITLTDAQSILKYALKIENCSQQLQMLADVSEDLKITLEDAQILLQAALKIIPWEKYVDSSAEEEREISGNIKVKDNSAVISSWEPFLTVFEDPDYYIQLPYDPEYPPVDKPVIYLYPEENTEIEVKLDFNGDFTFTWPNYRDGWKVIAEPDGKLTDTYDGSEHQYLFWEGKSNVQYTFDEGFCVKGEDTAAFLKEALEIQGLTPKEYNDFITFWVPRMQENEYNVISFVEDVYTDNAKLSFSQEPDTMKRVFMAWYGSDEEVEIQEQELTGFERKGFTVVEWGGAEVSPSSYKRN